MTETEIVVRRPFHMDRSITVGLIVTVIFQTAGVFMWAGGAAVRLSALESQLSVTPGIAERLARLEGQTTQMARSLSRIERELIRED